MTFTKRWEREIKMFEKQNRDLSFMDLVMAKTKRGTSKRKSPVPHKKHRWTKEEANFILDRQNWKIDDLGKALTWISLKGIRSKLWRLKKQLI